MQQEIAKWRGPDELVLVLLLGVSSGSQLDETLPATTSVKYLMRTRIRSCNILTADLWDWRCDSTGSNVK